jgi:hypothetical protein
VGWVEFAFVIYFPVGRPLPCGISRIFSTSFVGSCIVTFWTTGVARVLASSIANCRARIESAHSNSSYCTSSSSSVVSYVCTELLEGGALSLPLIEAIPFCVPCSFGGDDGDHMDGLSPSISISRFYGWAIILFASSIMFGADLVGVADMAGVGIANASLQLRCGLRWWFVDFLMVFASFACDAIIASKRPTSKAMLLNTSYFSLAASSALNPTVWS